MPLQRFAPCNIDKVAPLCPEGDRVRTSGIVLLAEKGPQLGIVLSDGSMICSKEYKVVNWSQAKNFELVRQGLANLQ